MHTEKHNHKEHKHEECGCHSHHEHKHEDCGCRSHHSHGHCCGCSHAHAKYSKKEFIIKGISIAVFILSFLAKGQFSSLLICTIAVILCGYEFFVQGIKSLIKLKFDENTLIAIAAVASIVMKEHNEAYLITVLFSLGQFLEGYAVEKSRKRIESLIDVTVDIAHNEHGEEISPYKLRRGDMFMAKSGDKICVDGILTDAEGVFDASAITGESMPVNLLEGDAVISGYINIGSPVMCRATEDYQNSTASKIKRYVENASERKSAQESFITRFASIYTPAIIVIAVIMGSVLALFGVTTVYEAFRRALTFMIASCPCALVISIPLAYYSAIGSMSRNGLLVKGSEYINKMANADIIAFDKTGTLTTGKPEISDVVCLADASVTQVLSFAKSLEIHSLHPIAKAICDYYKGEYESASNVKEYAGKGMEGYIGEHFAVIGTAEFMQEKGYSVTQASSGILLYIDGNSIAEICISDKLKSDSQETIIMLKKLKFKELHLFSGDNKANVEAVGAALGINVAHSLTPHDKAHKISELKKKAKNVIFVGDGINDAPSLAEADFSVSMGSGSSLALETGDATLISKNLTTIPKSIKKASCTVNVVYTNIVLSIVVKFAVLVLAATGFAPVWLAVLADVGTLIVTVLNSLTVFIRK